MKTNVYVDAFNLYYGCLKNTNYRWLDISKLCANELPTNNINKIRYFTARVKGRPNDPQQPDRQNVYFRALGTIPGLSIHEGQYLEKDVWMPLSIPFDPNAVNIVPRGSQSTHPPGTPIVSLSADGSQQLARVKKSEEKGSDVNLASYLLLDGFRQDYEVAIVITNDSDLAEPIRLVRTELKLPVVVLHPCRLPAGPNVTLKKVSSKSISISDVHLAASQFPDPLTLANGKTITKPASW